jgi:hypothetical protein
MVRVVFFLVQAFLGEVIKKEIKHFKISVEFKLEWFERKSSCMYRGALFSTFTNKECRIK